MAAGEADGLSSSVDARQAFVASDELVRDIRARATALVREVAGDANYRDVNYVFPTFVTEHMPVGLVGLLIAAIFAAAMSSIAAELNSLSTATVIDFYKRLFRQEAPDAHYLLVSKIATGFWGAFACIAAVYAANLDSLIVIVNRIGSLFYGSILGVFILALGFRRANGIGASVGLLAGMTAVGLVAAYTSIAFLWHNVIGAVVVTIVGVIVSAMTGGPAAERPRVR
jgi:Na+/proline symporter